MHPALLLLLIPLFGQWTYAEDDYDKSLRKSVCEGPTPVGGTPITGYCDKTYTFIATPATYLRAQYECHKTGGTLVTFCNAEQEAKLIEDYVPTEVPDIWIGQNSVRNRDQFEWDSGSRCCYENWEENEPNNAFLGEPYVFWRRRTRKWNDRGRTLVEKKKPYICEVCTGVQKDELENKMAQPDMPEESDEDIETEQFLLI